MKKVLLFAAAGLFFANLTACGPSEEDQKKAEEMLKSMGLDSASMNKAMNEMKDTTAAPAAGDTGTVK